ncbi:MAG: electron transfer flavoprotein subunit beta/FixA family protein [Bdellovibrionales bacterium]|nr:electron transfer flavoprotein subunit beta/FixA family protein [Bdellovibrionales bacterium]
MAKILVPLKRVPDYEIKVKLGPSGKDIQKDGIKWIVNPFDEIAVEEALRLREARSDVEEIVVCSIGPAETSEQLRTALAMGADRAILVVTDEYIDSDAAHRILAELFRRGDYQLILMGKQSIDSDAGQTGQLLGARLELPQATFASKVVIDESWSTAEVTREVDGGLETLKVSLPAVITTDLRLNEPRYPSLPNIVKAKKKPLEEVALQELGVDVSPKVRITAMALPEQRQAGVKVGSVEELVAKLKDEAKVL